MQTGLWRSFVVGLVTFSSSISLSAAEFVPLFDGKSLDNWVQHGGEAKYTIEGDQIVGTSVPDTPNSFLCTKKH